MIHDPLDVVVLLGSTREGRFGPTVARWFMTQAGTRDDITAELIDLADIGLPAHHPSRHGDEIARYVDRIDRADAYVVVTPEYNHGYPASLKMAIDLPHAEWRN